MCSEQKAQFRPVDVGRFLSSAGPLRPVPLPGAPAEEGQCG